MTGNQIEWAKHIETRRHNLATEVEMNRHNVVTEDETYRHNFAVELETYRHNLAGEVETNRHNVVVENETHRHNVATEDIGWYNARASMLHAQAAMSSAAAAHRQASVAAYNAETERTYKVGKAQTEFISATSKSNESFAKSGYYSGKLDVEMRGQDMQLYSQLIGGAFKLTDSGIKAAAKMFMMGG